MKTILIRTMLFLGILALGVLLISGGPPQDGDSGKGDGERLRHLLGTAPLSVMQHPVLRARESAQLVAQTAISVQQLATVRRYRAELNIASGPGRVEAAFMDISMAGNEMRLGVGWTENGAVVGPVLYDGFSRPVTDHDVFLDQFRGDGGLRLTPVSVDPVGMVLTRRDEFLESDRAPEKKGDRESWALFRHHLLMWEAEDLHRSLQKARQEGQPLVPPLRRLSSHLQEVDRFSVNLKSVLEPKDLGQYRRFVDELVANVEKASVLSGKGNEKAAGKIVKAKVKMGCGRCHGWDQNSFGRPLEGALERKKESFGWASGVFVVDVDVREGDLSREDAQSIASAIKAVMLLARGKD